MNGNEDLQSGVGATEGQGTPEGVNPFTAPDPAPGQGIGMPSQTPDTHEVQVRGEKMNVSLDDLKAGYMMNADYTQSKQELAEQRRSLEPYIEFAEFLQANPQVVAQLQSSMGQVAPNGGPEVPDPRYKELEDRLMDNEFALQAMRFQAQYPEANMDEVVEFGLKNGIPHLESAYKAMMYDKIKTGEAQQFVEAQQQKKAAVVEQTGGSQPPTPRQVDLTGKSTQERIEAGIEVYGPLTI